MKITLLVIILSLLSCAAPVSNIPDSITNDIKNEIIFFKSSSSFLDEFTGDKISFTDIHNKNASSLYSGSFFNKILSGQKIIPFISPKGKYAVYYDRLKIPGKLSLSVHELSNGEIRAKLTADRPDKTYRDEPYMIHWVKNRELFYFSKSDSIFQFNPDDPDRFIANIPDLHSFIISPDEKFIFACHQDNVGIYDIIGKKHKIIYSIKKFLGMPEYMGVKLCLSASGRSLCFSSGRQIHIYNPYSDSLLNFKSTGEIFYMTMTNDDFLIYISGSYPSDGSQLDKTEAFHIVRLDIPSGVQKTLHSRINHEPFSVQPEINGPVILFSERRLNGGYQIKVMTVEGKYMNTICDGIYPSWKY
jgi:hypothetical protein